jgi:hypothetical protein
MQLEVNEFNRIVERLRDADGEDLQDILIELGMDEQLFRQLIMMQPIQVVTEMYNERMEFENEFKQD